MNRMTGLAFAAAAGATAVVVGRALRRQIHAHLLGLSPAALGAFPAGDLMARATNDVQAVEMTAGEAVLSVFDGVMTGVLVLGVMVFTPVSYTHLTLPTNREV